MNERRPVAMVSGGSRGIGRAVATRLARDGFDVAFCFRHRSDAADEVAKEIEVAGGRAYAAEVDVAHADRVREFVVAAEGELGPLTTVVTAAGVTRDRPLATMNDDEWRTVIGTNLDGTYNVCRAALRSLMRNRGCVVTLSSIAGRHGSVGQANYAASKAGIIGFTLSLAREYGRYGVRANVVAPGFIETDMTAAIPDQARKRHLARIPVARFGASQEVAAAVSFLASDQASYVTGQVVGVDGGLLP